MKTQYPRFFVHKNGFKDCTAFVRIDSKSGSTTLVNRSGKEIKIEDQDELLLFKIPVLNEKFCLKYKKLGWYKEITKEQAENLITKRLAK